ncbi:MAG: major capsid protein, partial [Alphaproteobacteria bacterium]
NVRSTYQNWAAAAELRQNAEFESFPYGGIVFHNYQGTDDFDDAGTEGTEMFGIPSTKAKFFPVGAPGVFEAAWSPGESFDFANTPGLPMYGMIVRDLQRNQWAQPEVYSYPLFMCTRPAMLQRAKLA